MPPEAWGAIGVVVAAVVAAIGGRLVSRQSTRAAEKTHTLDARKQSWEEVRGTVTVLYQEVARLRDAREQDREDAEKAREKDRKDIDRLGERVTFLERRYRAAVDYVRVLLRWIKRHVPDEAVPPAPEEIADEF